MAQALVWGWMTGRHSAPPPRNRLKGAQKRGAGARAVTLALESPSHVGKEEHVDEITLLVVQRAVAGERAAMEQIMRALERPFFNLALRMLLSPVEAEDATQECLLRVATRLAQFWAWPKDEDPNARRFSRLMGGPIGRFFGLNFNAIPHVFFSIGTRDALPDDALEMYLRPFRRPDRREPTLIFPREIIASRKYLAEVDTNLPRVADRPALIIWGAKDGGFRPPDRERFERIFPKHRTVPLETAKHFIQEDEPGRVAAEIRAFLRAPLM